MIFLLIYLKFIKYPLNYIIKKIIMLITIAFAKGGGEYQNPEGHTHKRRFPVRRHRHNRNIPAYTADSTVLFAVSPVLFKRVCAVSQMVYTHKIIQETS